jgi:hypothetical protein
MIELEDFSYEDDTHEYRNSAGELRQSATGCLKEAGLVDYSMVDPFLLETKRVIGKNVHKWTAVHDTEGDNDPMIITAREWGYCQAWLSFKRDFAPEFVEVEKPMMGLIGKREVGGTPDNIAMMKRAMWIIDKKCCSVTMPSWEIQTAIYEMLKSRAPYLGLYNRMSVILKPDGSYRPVVYQDARAAVVATAAVALAYDKDDHNSRRIVEAWAYNKRVRI